MIEFFSTPHPGLDLIAMISLFIIIISQARTIRRLKEQLEAKDKDKDCPQDRQ